MQLVSPFTRIQSTPIPQNTFQLKSVPHQPVNVGQRQKSVFQKRKSTRQICTAEVTSEPENKQVTKYASNLFGLLTVAFGATWIASVVAPKFIMQNAFNLTISHELKTNFVGFVAYFPVMAACLKSLKSAVENDRLGSDTYRRINLGLVVFCIASLINSMKLMSSGLIGVTAFIVTHVLVLLLAGYGYAQHPFFAISGSLRGLVSGMFSPQNLASFLYGAICIACLYGFYVFGIKADTFIFSVLPESDVAVFMKRSQGMACLLYAMVAVVLKDAANRGRLGASTFKNLNIGMFLMVLSNCLDFVWARVSGAAVNKSAYFSNEIATGIVALFLFTQILAKKK